MNRSQRTRSRFQRRELVIEFVEITLPVGFLRRERYEPRHDPAARLQRIARLSVVLLRDIDGTEIGIAAREIVLPARVARIGLGETAADRKAVLV